MNATDIAGILVSDETIGALRAARVAGKEAMFRRAEPAPDDCPNCGGLGLIIVCLWPPRAGAEERVAMTWDGQLRHVEQQRFACPVCASDRPTKLELLARSSGLTDSERQWRLDHYQGMAGKEMALAAALDLLALTPRPTGWLFLYGPYGVGKSGMLKALTASFVSAGVSAAYVTANDILIGLRASFGDDAGATEAELLARWGSYQFLAVDEINRTSDTAWARNALFSLLDHRYNRRDTLATAMATNLGPDEFPPDLQYLSSRMLDAERVPVGGAVLRGVKA